MQCLFLYIERRFINLLPFPKVSDVNLIKGDMVFGGFFLLSYSSEEKKTWKTLTMQRQIIDVLTRITLLPDEDNLRMSHDILKPYHCRFSSYSHRNTETGNILHETDQYWLGRSHPDTVDHNWCRNTKQLAKIQTDNET